MDKNDREAEHADKRFLANLVLIMIALTLVFMMVVTWTHIKINNDVACGWGSANLYRHDLGIQNSTILNGANEYAIMRSQFNKTAIVGAYEFCFYAIASGNNLHTHVIDENNTILAHIYPENSTMRFCADIEEQYIRENMYIGIRCDDCGPSDTITLQESILGSQTRIEGNDVSFVVSSDNPFAYDIYWQDSCRPMLKFWMGIYVILMSVFIFLILLLIGLNKMSAWILNFAK